MHNENHDYHFRERTADTVAVQNDCLQWLQNTTIQALYLSTKPFQEFIFYGFCSKIYCRILVSRWAQKFMSSVTVPAHYVPAHVWRYLGIEGACMILAEMVRVRLEYCKFN